MVEAPEGNAAALEGICAAMGGGHVDTVRAVNWRADCGELAFVYTRILVTCNKYLRARGITFYLVCFYKSSCACDGKGAPLPSLAP